MLGFPWGGSQACSTSEGFTPSLVQGDGRGDGGIGGTRGRPWQFSGFSGIKYDKMPRDGTTYYRYYDILWHTTTGVTEPMAVPRSVASGQQQPQPWALKWHRFQYRCHCLVYLVLLLNFWDGFGFTKLSHHLEGSPGMPLQRPAAVFSKAQNENDGWAKMACLSCRIHLGQLI